MSILCACLQVSSGPPSSISFHDSVCLFINVKFPILFLRRKKTELHSDKCGSEKLGKKHVCWFSYPMYCEVPGGRLRNFPDFQSAGANQQNIFLDPRLWPLGCLAAGTPAKCHFLYSLKPKNDLLRDSSLQSTSLPLTSLRHLHVPLPSLAAGRRSSAFLLGKQRGEYWVFSVSQGAF